MPSTGHPPEGYQSKSLPIFFWPHQPHLNPPLILSGHSPGSFFKVSPSLLGQVKACQWTTTSAKPLTVAFSFVISPHPREVVVILVGSPLSSPLPAFVTFPPPWKTPSRVSLALTVLRRQSSLFHSRLNLSGVESVPCPPLRHSIVTSIEIESTYFQTVVADSE